MRPFAFALIAHLLPLPLFAAVPGVPEPPRPGPFPATALWWGNDAFGAELGENADDYRTNEVAAQALIAQRWLFAIDHSMLTNKTSDLAPEGRSDEITGTAGILVEHAYPEMINDRLWMAAGIGVRAAGHFAGQESQNAIHRPLDLNTVHLPYDRDRAAGVAYVSGGWLWLEHFPITFPPLMFLERGNVGINSTAAALATTAGEQQTEIGAALTFVGVDGAAWIGPRVRWDTGYALSTAAEAVAKREDGLWLDYGVSAGGWFVSGGVNLRDQTTLGAVGWAWDRPINRTGEQDPAVVEADLEFSGGFSPGTQLRWQPECLRHGDALAQHTSVIADYRFGQVDDVDWGPDSLLNFNQFIVGMEVASSRPRSGWQAVPFIRGGAGVRYEVVRVRGPDPRFDAQSAATGVILGGAGLRVSWGRAVSRTASARYGFAAFYDAWLPFTHATARNGNDRSEYMRSGAAPGVALTTAIAW